MRFKQFSFVFFLLAGHFYSPFAGAQVTVSGPGCVLPGLGYQYSIQAGWSGNATLQVCVTGGILADSSTHCRNGSPVSFVRIIWDSSASAGSISITSSAGNSTQQVTIAQPLQAGALDPQDTLQYLTNASLPIALHCAAATGGSCSPSYVYQWQQSEDAMNWTDTAGVTGQDFLFSATLPISKYYRLKVTESISGSIDYSVIAAILVIPPSTGMINNRPNPLP
ncbi:MAG: hypothetical protein P4L51_14520 [Puia sp.]|nr:hypothetical protein [Puia sp.]